MYMLIVQRGYLSCVGEGGFNGPESPEIAVSSVFLLLRNVRFHD